MTTAISGLLKLSVIASVLLLTSVFAHEVRFNRIVIKPNPESLQIELAIHLDDVVAGRLTQLRLIEGDGAKAHQAKVDEMGADVLAGLDLSLGGEPINPHRVGSVFDPYSHYLLVRAHYSANALDGSIALSFDQGMPGAHASVTQVEYVRGATVHRRHVDSAGDRIVFSPSGP